MPATNGHVPRMAHPYPELVNLEPLPGRTQDEFREAFEAFLAQREEPWTHDEYQLAYVAAREAWRACWWMCARARAAEERREMAGEFVALGATVEIERRREYVAADVEVLG